MTANLIIEPRRVQQKLQRMALEIHERNSGQNLFLAGIDKSGFEVAEMIAGYLRGFSGKDLPVYKISINKQDPLNSEVKTDLPSGNLENATLIIIDDVQNSGRTMMYCIRHFLQFPLRSVQTCVLVDRLHNDFPVKSDYTGISLSTTLQEHVTVDVNQDEVNIYMK